MRHFLRRLFFRSSIDKDVREELESHIAMRAERNRASGMSEKDATYTAQRQFGNATNIQERIYEFNSFAFMDTLFKDLRYAIRGLCRNPGLSLTIILTIAVSIGIVTSMFSLMRDLLLAPPPHIAEPDRTFRLHYLYPGEERTTREVTSYPFYELLTDRANSLESVACYETERNGIAAGSGSSARLTRAVMVSAGFWSVLGTKPLLGRFIEDEEAHPVTGSRVVVLGYGFWKRAFGGRTEAIGSTLRIKGQPYEVIGVAPRGFRGVEMTDVDLWLPFFARDDGSGQPVSWHMPKSSYFLRVLARLKPDATMEQTAQELSILRRIFLEDAYSYQFKDPARNKDDIETYRKARVLLGSVNSGLGEDMRPLPEAQVTAWLVGVAFVLLAIACSNIAGLLLLRAMRRREEIAVRLALGVSRGRLARQFLTESSILVLLGGLIAIFTVAFGGSLLYRIILPAMAWEPARIVDTNLLAVAGACIVIAAFAAGMAPLLYAKSGITSSLHNGSLRGPARRSRMQALLLVTQGALSIVLLIGAGLFIRSLHNAHSVDIGVDRDNVLAVQIDFSGTGKAGAYEAAFFERALERVSGIPGVERASLASNIPLRSHVAGVFWLPSHRDPLVLPTGGAPYVTKVTPGFFATTGMRILEGRGFQENERRGGNVIVISEPMARLGWPDQSPIGECVHVEQNNEYDNKCTTIVGVVADSRMNRISEERPHLFWYQPLAVGEELRYFLRRALLVRMAPGIGRLDNTIRRVLYELDPELPYIKIETLGEALDPEIRPWRLGASVFTAFGLFAMVLAMVGLWASVAYSVSQRTHEFAVRMAMGATWRSLVSVIIREGMKNTLVTVAAGLLIAYLVSRFIADMLFNVSPYDPVVFVSVAAGILIVSTIASLLPAFRAARIDPARSLKAD